MTTATAPLVPTRSPRRAAGTRVTFVLTHLAVAAVLVPVLGRDSRKA